MKKVYAAIKVVKRIVDQADELQELLDKLAVLDRSGDVEGITRLG